MAALKKAITIRSAKSNERMPFSRIGVYGYLAGFQAAEKPNFISPALPVLKKGEAIALP
jgi:hypothetical protein